MPEVLTTARDVRQQLNAGSWVGGISRPTSMTHPVGINRVGPVPECPLGIIIRAKAGACQFSHVEKAGRAYPSKCKGKIRAVWFPRTREWLPLCTATIKWYKSNGASIQYWEEVQEDLNGN